MKVSTNVDFHEDKLDLSDRLQIKGKILPDPFSIPETEMSGHLENIPPFCIEDIFNFLIFKSGEYEGLLKGLGHKERASRHQQSCSQLTQGRQHWTKTQHKIGHRQLPDFLLQILRRSIKQCQCKFIMAKCMKTRHENITRNICLIRTRNCVSNHLGLLLIKTAHTLRQVQMTSCRSCVPTSQNIPNLRKSVKVDTKELYG